MVGYQCSVKITTKPVELFNALTMNISSWWGEADNEQTKVGDVFTVSWGEPWYKFEVVEFIPAVRLVWKCIDANQIITGLEGVQKEWVGTAVHWDIKEENGWSLLEFEHRGLVPEFICFDVCSRVWRDYITNKLKSYLENKD